jgi:hypothetical protein
VVNGASGPGETVAKSGAVAAWNADLEAMAAAQIRAA